MNEEPNLYKEYWRKKRFGNGGGGWEDDEFTFRNAKCSKGHTAQHKIQIVKVEVRYT